MSLDYGTVVNVVVSTLGDELAADVAAGAASLTVVDAVDFSEDGGTLTIGDETVDYTAVDDETGVVTLAAALVSAYVAGDRVLRFPVGQEMYASVQQDVDVSAVEVRVPQTLWTLLPEGIRTDGELVSFERRDGDLVLLDVLGAVPVFDYPVRLSDRQGGISGGVDEAGNVVSADLSYQGVFQASAATMLIDGIAYATHLAAQPQGVIRFAERNPLVAGIQAEYGILNVDFATETDRNVSIWCVVQLKGSVTPSKANLRIRHETSATAPVSASVTSTLLLLSSHIYSAAVATSQDFEFSHTMDLPAGWHSLWFSVHAPGGGTQTFDTDGVARITVQDQGPPALVDNGAYKPAAPGTLHTGGTDTGSTAAPAKRTYTRSYNATTTNWWEGNGTYRPADNQYTGWHGGEGNRRAAVWFDETKIRSDLQGATVLSARVRLGVWDGGNGKTLVVGSHKQDSPTQDYSAITGKAPDRTRKAGVNEGTLVWVDLGFELAGWKTDLAGLLVGPGPTNSLDFACSFRGVGHNNRPVLEISFEK